MPSLMRIFTSAEHVVEYKPNREETVELAAQATEYGSYVFWEDNNGFLILHDTFKDALGKKTGIVKWWTDPNTKVSTKTYGPITEEQLKYVLFQLDELGHSYEIVGEPKFDDGQDADGQPTRIAQEVVIKTKVAEPLHRVEAIPPDEFRINRSAKAFKSATLVGHERLENASKLIQMGIPREIVEENINSGSYTRWNEERYYRNPGLEDGGGSQSDGKQVLLGEYYIRIDKDGDGIDELHLITTVGDSYTIVGDEEVDYVKMCSFCPDPEPHTAIGHSLTELVKDLQKIKTNILRSSPDSLSQTIYPRLVINETLTNIDDVLNDETGAPIRTKGNVLDSVQQLQSTFVGQPAMMMVDYIDRVRQQRTGISEASKGLDPSALQSTNVKGVDMVITGAQERIELIARILAETGFKELFKGLLREMVEHPNKNRVVRLRGKWTPVQPDMYDPSMDVKVNPAIGRGSDMDRMTILSQVKQTQEMIMQTMGLDNGMVTPEEYRNTITDILAIANIKNTSRYFKSIDPAKIQEMMEAVRNKKDPAMIIAEAEVEKIRANTAKTIAETDLKKAELAFKDKQLTFEMMKFNRETDFKYDKLETDSAVKIYDIDQGIQHGQAVENIRHTNNMERDSEGRTHEKVMTAAKINVDEHARTDNNTHNLQRETLRIGNKNAKPETGQD